MNPSRAGYGETWLNPGRAGYGGKPAGVTSYFTGKYSSPGEKSDLAGLGLIDTYCDIVDTGLLL